MLPEGTWVTTILGSERIRVGVGRRDEAVKGGGWLAVSLDLVCTVPRYLGSQLDARTGCIRRGNLDGVRRPERGEVSPVLRGRDGALESETCS